MKPSDAPKIETESRGVRLGKDRWKMLRRLMQRQGREWLEMAIDSEYFKVFGKRKS